MKKKLKKIKIVVSDVDGVLTDGKIYLGGGEELKSFWSKDAPRTAVLLRSGIPLVLFTARKCSAVERRAGELKVDLIYKQAINDTGKDLFDVLGEKYKVQPEEVLYIGDDWSDLYCMHKAGVAVTPADGSRENKKVADIVTNATGGHGVIAEVAEIIMRAQNTWNSHTNSYVTKLTY
ncbi:MAG: HAD hydrolase family protein [Candidatus Pacebacteria bacterium]|nr:HAD hydrolase family protein [Candidatus Paceibacterota bacterium]